MGVLKTISNIDGWVSKSSLYATLRHTLLLVPVFLAIIFGCQKLETNPPHKRNQEIRTEERLDAFIYEDDSLMRLDAHNVFPTTQGYIGLDSRAGKKKIVLLGNSPIKAYEWHQIQSYAAFEELYHDIENEDINKPFSNSILNISAGRKIEVKLRPFLSRIVVRSLKCDFKGKPYEDISLENIKIYLTNISARVFFTQEDFSHPIRFVNQGRLNDWAKYHTIKSVGKTCLYPMLELFCFPNTCIKDGVGTPFTRLVIEGSINSQTYYYPININRTPGNGVERNREYIFDICLTQTGTNDPDIPIEKEEAEVKLKIKEWNEKEEYEISF